MIGLRNLSMSQVDEVIDDFIKPLGIPALAGLDYGHDNMKYTMPIGMNA